MTTAAGDLPIGKYDLFVVHDILPETLIDRISPCVAIPPPHNRPTNKRAVLLAEWAGAALAVYSSVVVCDRSRYDVLHSVCTATKIICPA